MPISSGKVVDLTKIGLRVSGLFHARFSHHAPVFVRILIRTGAACTFSIPHAQSQAEPISLSHSTRNNNSLAGRGEDALEDPRHWTKVGYTVVLTIMAC